MSLPPHDPKAKPAGHMWTWTQYAPREDISPPENSPRNLQDEIDDWAGLIGPQDHDDSQDIDDDDDDGNDYEPPDFDEYDDEPSAPTVSLPADGWSGSNVFSMQNPFMINTCSAGFGTGVPAMAPNLHYSTTHEQPPTHYPPTSVDESSPGSEVRPYGATGVAQPLDNGEDLFEEDEYASQEPYEENEPDNGDAEVEQNDYSAQPRVRHRYDAGGLVDSGRLQPGHANIDREDHGFPLYLTDPHGGPSPTESQLMRDDFEFHRGLGGLSEEQQMERFGRIADMDAINHVEPDVSRKKQWYAFKQAHTIAGDGGDDYDEEEVDEFTRMMDSGHDCGCHGESAECSCPVGQCKCAGCAKQATDEQMGCGCGGDAGICACAPGQCSCAGCGQDEDDGDDRSAPMDIGKTPITPTFPTIVKIPGLGDLTDDLRQDEPAERQPLDSADAQPSRLDAPPVSSSQTSQVQNPGCGCICGDDCTCARGNCNCDANHAPPKHIPEGYKGDRLANKALGWLIKKAAEENEVDTYHPNHERSPTRPTRLSHSSTSSPLGPTPRMTPINDLPRRPDTPRPFDQSVRQSIEPEGPSPSWPRESTPGYEDRSPSPSPLSHQGDVHMRDATPTPVRQGSIPPPYFAPPRPAASQAPNRQPRPDSMTGFPRTTSYPTQYPTHFPAQHPGQLVSQPAPASTYYQPPGYGTSNQIPQTSNSEPSQLPQSVYERPPQLPGSPRHLLPPPRQSNATATPPPPASRSRPSIRAPPIPTSPLQPSKTRKANNSSNSNSTRRKSVVADSGISKASTTMSSKSRAVSRKVTNKQPRQKTAAQKKKDEGKVAAAVKKIEDAERKERERRDAWEKEDAERVQSDGTPVRRSGRIKRKREASGDFKP